MPLQLYSCYTPEQVPALLGFQRKRTFLDGALVSDGSVSALFVTASKDPGGTHFDGMDTLIWRRRGRSKRPPATALGDISVLCQRRRDGKYTFVGHTGIHPMAVLDGVELQLSPALDAQRWKQLGGYRLSKAWVDDEAFLLSTLAQVRSLLGRVRRQGRAELSLRRPDGGRAFCLFNEARALVSVQPEDLDWWAVETPRYGASGGTVAFTLHNGQVDHVPANWTITRETALAVVERMLRGEERPDLVRWKRPRR